MSDNILLWGHNYSSTISSGIQPTVLLKTDTHTHINTKYEVKYGCTVRHIYSFFGSHLIPHSYHNLWECLVKLQDKLLSSEYTKRRSVPLQRALAATSALPIHPPIFPALPTPHHTQLHRGAKLAWAWRGNTNSTACVHYGRMGCDSQMLHRNEPRCFLN